MNEWNKGNQPPFSGLYWVTVNEAENTKMYDVPMQYDNVTRSWKLGNANYCTANIQAYVSCNKPKEAYNEAHIGFPSHYYIRLKCNGSTRYLSKGLQSVKWSKAGYETKEKAIAAAKRLRKKEPEYGYAGQKTEIAIVNGNGEIV